MEIAAIGATCFEQTNHHTFSFGATSEGKSKIGSIRRMNSRFSS